MAAGPVFALTGFGIGTAAAVAPTAYACMQNKIKRPITGFDFLTCKGGKFVTRSGKEVILKGMNINDEVFYCFNNDIPVEGGNGEIFDLLEKRFGNYGARNLMTMAAMNRITDEDIKYFRKANINCVRIPLRYNLLFKNGNIDKEEPDFEKLDELINKCRKAGIYVILDLHSAPGCQNNDKSCGKADSCQLFDSGKSGFDYRNETVKLWIKIAKRYKNEPAVAAYDILNRPLKGVPEFEKKQQTLFRLFRRIVKAIRQVDDSHVIILENAGVMDNHPDIEKIGDENIALGIYSHYHTIYEAKSVMKTIRKIKEQGMPVIACKVRLYEDCAHIPDLLDEAGISWLGGDFKGTGPDSFLYGMQYKPVDVGRNSYDELMNILAKTQTSEYNLNPKLDEILKASCMPPEREPLKIYYSHGIVYKAGK